MASASHTSSLSEALHQITLIKIAELDKKRIAYASKKKKALEIESEHDPSEHDQASIRKHANSLAKNVVDMKLPFADKGKLDNTLIYLKQASFDPSMPRSLIPEHVEWWTTNVHQQSNRLDYATLFSALLSEHLDGPRGHSPSSTENLAEDDSSLDGSFEILEKDRLQQLNEKFENVVFNEYETDEGTIHDYLKSLFATEELKDKINGMRDRLKSDITNIFEAQDPFDADVLGWVIRGLLHRDALKDEQKALLKNFQTDELVRDEVCEVLNMRWADLVHWQWTEDETGLDVEPRRQLNGKYRVWMQEDILQSILTHYIGVKLCVNAKTELKYWLEDIMIPESPVTRDDADIRKFYLQDFDTTLWHNSFMGDVNTMYWNDVFLSQLPNSVKDTGGYDDDVDTGTKAESDNKKSWLQTQQQLLHHVASNLLIERKLHGDFAVVQTDLQWFATSLPHSTIYAVLRFCGIPDKWIKWFKTYLEVPLNTTKSAGEQRQVQKRKRGIPMSHALETYLGEIVLVFLDVAVKREADLLLYRMHDDIMLCGPTEKCEKAWATMQRFVEVMGLEFNKKKTGSIALNATSSKTAALPEGDVAVNFLKLSTDQGLWVIDNDKVDAHIKQLKKQLDECEDIISYIRTYNSCIGRFFGHSFGLPAYCLGQKHVEDILQTHKRMQEELFGEAGISSVLKHKLQILAHEQGELPDDFEVKDSFIFNPILLGGLGVANPFIPLLLVESDLRKKTPEQRVDDFIAEEKSTYIWKKRNFEGSSLSSRKRRRTEILDKDGSNDIKIDIDNFMSFEEYTKNRKWYSRALQRLYKDLMTSPTISDVRVSTRVVEDLTRMTSAGAKNVMLKDLTTEEKYVVQMFSEQMFETFGTVGIVDRTLAPLGVMKAVMGEKVTWQMVL